VRRIYSQGRCPFKSIWFCADKGGSKVVTVSENAPVVTFAPATRADLTAGKKVFVLTTLTKRGVFEAHVLLVEKDGVVPPI